MAQWKNTSGSTFERPGDGEDSPGWLAEPGDTVEADTNPVPGCFDPADEPPAPPADEQPAPAAEVEE